MSDRGKERNETSFADLFEANPITPEEDLRPGDTVSCEVVKISTDHIFVDLGAKSEGIADAVEFLDEEGRLTVKVGDHLELRVSRVTDIVCLSKGIKVKGAEALDILREAYENGLPVEGRFVGVKKGGLEVDISGVRAFCPQSQIDIRYCEDLEEQVGSRHAFRILEFKERGKNLVVSRRKILEEERERLAQETLAALKKGEEREGRVTRLANFGAFVDIGGVEGMVHISEMAHHRLRHPSEFLKEGETVRVLVMEVDGSPEDRPRIALSMKALVQTPWEQGLVIREGQIVRGKITRIKDFGAFVELAPGFEGLVHVSEISYQRVSHPGKVLEEDQEVDVRVLAIDHERRRISLSIKEADGGLSPEQGSPLA
jgi:small subunit ribosomal protein S1